MMKTHWKYLGEVALVLMYWIAFGFICSSIWLGFGAAVIIYALQTYTRKALDESEIE